jgi:hypothetical protein
MPTETRKGHRAVCPTRRLSRGRQRLAARPRGGWPRGEGGSRRSSYCGPFGEGSTPSRPCIEARCGSGRSETSAGMKLDVVLREETRHPALADDWVMSSRARAGSGRRRLRRLLARRLVVREGVGYAPSARQSVLSGHATSRSSFVSGLQVSMPGAFEIRVSIVSSFDNRALCSVESQARDESGALLNERKKPLQTSIFQSDLGKMTANPGCGNQRLSPASWGDSRAGLRGMKYEVGT